MIDTKRSALKDRPLEVREQKRVPFTVKEVKSRQEILDWQAKSYAKSATRQKEIRQRAIAAFEAPKDTKKATTVVELPKKSFFARIYDFCINFLCNIKFN